MKNFDNKLNSTFHSLSNISKIKQREVFCPIAGVRVLTTPLLASDDLTLRTTISSADTYDYELIKLIFKHSSFPDLEISGQQMTIHNFISNLSHVDKQVILWGIVASTYSTLGDQKLICTHCKEENTETVVVEDLIQDDSFKLWEETASFIEYVYPIEKILNIQDIYSLTFNTYLPSIKRHLDILALIPVSKLKDNFEKSGSLLTKAEEMATVIQSIIVHKEINDIEPVIFSMPKDIHSIISNFIPLELIDEVLDSYGEKFNKYTPKFKKEITCKNCAKQFTYLTDIEFSLFKRFLRR